MNRLILIAALALAGCGPRVITKTEIKTVQVPVRVACPDKAVFDEVTAFLPVPLRTQPMPATADERVAKSQAQLGKYEAEGGWADRAMSALRRCQEGVATTP